MIFVTESAHDGAGFGFGRLAENTHGGGFLHAFGSTEIKAAATHFCVVAELALLDEQRTCVFFEEFESGG